MRLTFYRMFGSILLISIGLFIWLSNMNVLHVEWKRDWPAILIIIGLVELIKHIARGK